MARGGVARHAAKFRASEGSESGKSPKVRSSYNAATATAITATWPLLQVLLFLHPRLVPLPSPPLHPLHPPPPPPKPVCEFIELELPPHTSTPHPRSLLAARF